MFSNDFVAGVGHFLVALFTLLTFKRKFQFSHFTMYVFMYNVFCVTFQISQVVWSDFLFCCCLVFATVVFADCFGGGGRKYRWIINHKIKCK